MRPLIALALLTSLAVPGSVNLTAAGTPTRLLRTPSISATHVAFAYANNIWIVDRKGGDARRLTSFQGQSTQSQDLARWDDGRVQRGLCGQHRRLHRAGERRRAAAPDVASRRRHGAGLDARRHEDHVRVGPAERRRRSAAPRFWTVPVKGGIAEPMPLPRGYQGKISPDGRRIAYRMNTSWDEERRNYRGGQNRPVWIVDLKSFDLVSPPWTDSKDVDPAWLGDTVYFISDRDGIANVWSYDTATQGADAAHQVHRLRRQVARCRRRRGRVRAGRLPARLRSEGQQDRAADDQRGRRFPVDDDAHRGRDDAHVQHQPVADRQARAGRGARRDLHDSRKRRATSATSPTRAARRSASRRGRRTASGSRTSATSRANTSW